MDCKIFISYRRNDTFATAGRLYDRLEAHFGTDNIFLDVDNLLPGVDFVKELRRSIDDCDIILVLIGSTWLDSTDNNGKRKIDNPNDFVRIEIKIALEKNKIVIPVLIEDVEMPRSRSLPEVLKPLASRQASKLVHEQFNTDVKRLIQIVEVLVKNKNLESNKLSSKKTNVTKVSQRHQKAINVKTKETIAAVVNVINFTKHSRTFRINVNNTVYNLIFKFNYWTFSPDKNLYQIIVDDDIIWEGIANKNKNDIYKKAIKIPDDNKDISIILEWQHSAAFFFQDIECCRLKINGKIEHDEN